MAAPGLNWMPLDQARGPNPAKISVLSPKSHEKTNGSDGSIPVSDSLRLESVSRRPV
jgi:hypothetical protein